MCPSPYHEGAVLITYLTTDQQVLGILAWSSAAITLLGFIIAIWQITRVKRSADTAREAALGLVRQVRSRELLAQLANACSHLDAARNHLVSGNRAIAILCLELSRASIIEALQLSAGAVGDWEELETAVNRMREAERRLTSIADPLRDDPGYVPLLLLLRDVSESLQRSAALARYAYDVDGK